MLIHEPSSIVTLLIILAPSVAFDFGWKAVGANRVKPEDLKRKPKRHYPHTRQSASEARSRLFKPRCTGSRQWEISESAQRMIIGISSRTCAR